MKKVLIYENRKIDPIIWDITTDELKERAFLALFEYLRDEWQVYDGDPLVGRNKQLFESANSGDGKAAEELLRRRKNWEYENFTVETVR